MSLQDDLASGSQFLSPRKSPSHQVLSSRRSKSSLHGDVGARGASLAHELAAALMPEPSAGSRLLADEFGIEFDEGAEGIDEEVLAEEGVPPDAVVTDAYEDDTQPSKDWESSRNSLAFLEHIPIPEPSRRQQDPLTVLNQDLQTTDLFIESLRRLDTDPSSSTGYHTSSVYEPPLERLATDFIRRINDSTREREGQLRELREFEKEFRRIAGQTGGMEILGELAALDDWNGSNDEVTEESKTENNLGELSTVVEEEEPSMRRDTADWELDPNRVLGDDDGIDYNDSYRPSSPSPIKETSSLLPPPPSSATLSPSNTVLHLAYMRNVTQSLVQSLTTVVEHTQVTGAATADAGRKIRALKNKLGGWRAETESAERSMERIEKWEAAGGINSLSEIGLTNGVGGSQRGKLKQIMQEELSAFELVLAEAGRKTQAIMAAS